VLVVHDCSLSSDLKQAGLFFYVRINNCKTPERGMKRKERLAFLTGPEFGRGGNYA
jgi:hypothetical protein